MRLSWRGASGATGYDVQRAENAEGPWTTVGVNISDADTAYRPLFADVSAWPHRTWFYRVVARNESGVSPPSNVVGPVRFQDAWIIDELKDFALARESQGLKPVNEHNGCYAENLYRAAGDRGAEIVYEAPGELRRVKLTTWTAAKSAELRLAVSVDGQTCETLKATVQKIEYVPPPAESLHHGGKFQTEFDFTAIVPAGHCWLRLSWEGPVELDRVELVHRGNQ